MNSYVNAPATKMLAVYCACCSKPLVDSKSVESGMGPHCRKHHGYDLPGIDNATREKANAIVHAIAVEQTGDTAFNGCAELHVLGFAVLAARIMKRLTKIRIELTDDRLVVFAPFNAKFVADVQHIPGRKWVNASKTNTFPATLDSRRMLQKALSVSFAGKWAHGPRGPFRIEATA